jgi:uncharacterized glyoxalase superfamily protein PhnB
MKTRRKSPRRRATKTKTRRTKRSRAVHRTAKPASQSAPPRPASTGLAPGMQAVSAFLAVANVRASMEFLERTLGFSRGVTLPGADKQPHYAEMRRGDVVVMLVRKGDDTSASGGAAALYTYVDDVDGAIARVRDAGAGVVADAEDKPWGDRVAVVTDPDGYRWVLATFKKLAPFA